MAMPDQPLATSSIGLVSMGGEKSAQLSLDRLRDQIPSALAQKIRQRIGRKSCRRAKRDNRILRHVEYRSPSPAVLEPVAHPPATLSDQWRDMAHSLRDLRCVNNALICHPIPPSPTFSYSSRLFSLRSSPIETAFAKIKTLIRMAAARTYHQLWQAVGNVCNIFKEEECYNFFKAAGYETD